MDGKGKAQADALVDDKGKAEADANTYATAQVEETQTDNSTGKALAHAIVDDKDKAEFEALTQTEDSTESKLHAQIDVMKEIDFIP